MIPIINTVLGEIADNALGVTLMHEHITWAPEGAAGDYSYSVEEVVRTMLPYLLELKEEGCDSLVDATTYGAGRDVEVLIRCARESGLNILTNSGIWDGGKESGRFTPKAVLESDAGEIADFWSGEYFNGIVGTKVKPSYIKLAVGDTGEITGLQHKLLVAAARTHTRTGMTVQCHSFLAGSAVKAVNILEEEGMPLTSIIWVHADGGKDLAAALKMAERGAWIEFDCLAREKDFSWHIDAIRKVVAAGYTDRLLIAQDSGYYKYGGQNDASGIFPYSRLFRKFIPLCMDNGITRELFNRVLVKNTLEVLMIKNKEEDTK